MKLTFQFQVGSDRKQKYEVVAWADGECKYAAIEPMSMGINASFAGIDLVMLATVFEHFAEELRKMEPKP